MNERSASLPSEGEKLDDLIFDFVFWHALRDEQDVIDGRPNGLLVGSHNQAGDGLAVCEPLVGEADHRVAVVGDEDSMFRGGPCQYVRVRCPFRQSVLNPDQVEFRQPVSWFEDVVQNRTTDLSDEQRRCSFGVGSLVFMF